MKHIFKFLIFLPLVWGKEELFAQDFHLSQTDAAPHYFNPALTGMYFENKSDYKIYSDYRSQWKSLGIKPFSTYYLAYDMPHRLFGLGGYLIHNRNGAGGMNTINFMPSAAYRISNEVSTPHNLSVGAQLGIIYRNFDPAQFTFDSQFSADDPDGFDQSLPNLENFEKTSLLKIDANMGVFYKFKKPEWKAHPWGGFSVYHITKPNQSFTGIAKDRLPMRMVLQLGADYTITDQISAKPAILYMNQGKAQELTIGATGFYHIKETESDVLFGINYRIKDALVLLVGMKYGLHIIAFSYDINTSNLNDSTNGRGAFEFSIVLSGIKGQPFFNPKFKKGTSIKPL